jgi:NhaA family Na+:H+ antiporter
LLLGTPLGIIVAGYGMHRLGLGALPAGVGWRAVTGMGILAGIGFTISLFIAELAFDQQAQMAKGAVLFASVFAVALGIAWFSATSAGRQGDLQRGSDAGKESQP